MEAVRDFINVLSYPWWSFTLSLVLFWLMLRSKKLWTKKGGVLLFAGLTVFLGASVIDPNFRLVVAKPDNVPIPLRFSATR